MRVFAEAVDLGAAEKELELGKSDVRQAVHTPLDDACVEVARKVCERSVGMRCEGR